MSYIRFIRDRVGHERIFLNFVGALIEDGQGRILLQRRNEPGAAPRWGLIGGAMELGESFEEALAREVREETGLEIEGASLFGVYSKFFDRAPNGDEFQAIATVFRCRTLGTPKVNDDESLELRFFRPEEIDFRLFNAQNDQILADYRAGKGGVVVR